ncbi:MAG: glycine C-acetyltransferase [Chloroflexi bacterium]|nr:glycine C-acetyltransferase [Chloroflexota bacterium]
MGSEPASSQPDELGDEPHSLSEFNKGIILLNHSQRTRFLEDRLTELHEGGLYNTIRTVESPMDARIRVDGRYVLNFCANNYLGLANHPALREAAKKAIDDYGVGPGAVRSIAGTQRLHRELEIRLADFKGAEAVLTLQSGFSANLATIPAIVGRGDVIFSDRLNHASIIDGCRLSRAQIVPYDHADAADLARRIQETDSDGRRLIISDGVFSMDGDIAPLPELVAVAERYDCLLMIDDAHGEGVLGEGGRGIVDHFQMHGRVDIEIGTLSKAFGVMGGFVAGSQTLIDWLKQRGRPFIFSSALTMADVAACLAAVDLLGESNELVLRLWQNTEALRLGLQQLGFDTGLSTTPIVPIMLGDAALAQEFARQLFEQNVFAMAIAYPTVARGQARIRLMNSAAHRATDIEEALAAIADIGTALGVIP